MDKSEEVRQWFDIADKDLRSAEYLLTMRHPTPDEVICNLCQQAVEKYLKGFLRIHDVEIPKIHDLVALRKLCETIHPDFSVLAAKTGILTLYGVFPRYPMELPLSDDDAKFAVQYAQAIKEFIMNKQ